MSAAGLRIRRLPRDLVEKIAAGEVVERPASVVKELLENAIDAGATDVVISIERGDDLRLSVADDGIGMEREDALLAFERHATSKIREAADLEAVATLGFRGEALAAIGAVSEVEMSTRADGGEATRVVIVGGERTAAESAARARGTTIRVARLFFNTPARRKFLKTLPAEVRAIAREAAAHALAAPGVGVTLTDGGKTVLRLDPALPIAGRLGALYGHDVADALVAVEAREGDVEVRGLVSAPRATRGLSDAIHISVNGRPIESRALLRALLQGYDPLLPPRRYPVAAIALRVPLHRVDPNVHPTKREVRFTDEPSLFRFVRRAVARALAGEAIVPDLHSRQEGAADRSGPLGAADGALDAGASGAAASPDRLFGTWSGESLAESGPETWGARDPNARDSGTRGPGAPAASARSVLENLIAAPSALQVHKTYLVAESPDGIFLVDQHTAHERILYEEGLARIERSGGVRQPLLVPATIELSYVEANRLEEFAEPLERLGFGIRPIGPASFVIESVPVERRGDDIGRWLREILENLARDAGPHDRLARAARSFACKTAVRAGDTLAPEEIRSLLARLARARNPFACPHGRPVVARISLHEVERLFGRR